MNVKVDTFDVLPGDFGIFAIFISSDLGYSKKYIFVILQILNENLAEECIALPKTKAYILTFFDLMFSDDVALTRCHLRRRGGGGLKGTSETIHTVSSALNLIRLYGYLARRSQRWQ